MIWSFNMTYGVVLEGFKRKKSTAILAEINIATREVYGQNMNLRPQSVTSQFNQIFSDEMAFAWEQLEKLYHSTDPFQAEGVHLANLLNIMGLEGKAPATSTEVIILAQGVPGTVIDAGSEVEEVLSGERFVNRNKAIIGADGSVSISMYALNKGHLDILKDTATQINTAITGLSSVNNPNDGMPGKDEETDADARSRSSRVRSPESLADKMYNEISSSTAVNYSRIYYNLGGDNSSPVDAGHFAVVVDGSISSQDIARKIWLKYPLGMVADGDITEEVTDKQNFCRDIKFSRAIRVHAKVKVELEYCPSKNCGCIGGEDAFSDVEDSIFKWLEKNKKGCGWGIGINISSSILYESITKNHKQFTISKILLSGDGGVTWHDTLTAEWKEVFYFSRSNIEVNGFECD